MGPLTLVRWLLQRALKFEPPFRPRSKLKREWLKKVSGKFHLGGGDLFQLGSCSEGWLKLKSSLEKPSDKCQRTHIIQNALHDTLLFVSVKLGLIA